MFPDDRGDKRRRGGDDLRKKFQRCQTFHNRDDLPLEPVRDRPLPVTVSIEKQIQSNAHLPELVKFKLQLFDLLRQTAAIFRSAGGNAGVGKIDLAHLIAVVAEHFRKKHTGIDLLITCGKNH